ncbi:hypothetical protein TNIN_371781 [Trichonephila inaurata madagascariensis]|uniref:Uncharacterized protein n=1 Tax=Trichonephila inaurata madagascariensis TaxID=2747483 RepID=A0A8X6M9V4_9ARAC|nr:hypothetical protein TNIN_371781 [Trichonephila inaurata madagascariensis]
MVTASGYGEDASSSSPVSSSGISRIRERSLRCLYLEGRKVGSSGKTGPRFRNGGSSRDSEDCPTRQRGLRSCE